MAICLSCGNSINEHASTCAAILNNPHLQGENPSKWGSWVIADMPQRVLETALSDTDTQITRVSGRIKHPLRGSESLKYIGKLTRLKATLEAEKAKRDGR